MSGFTGFGPECFRFFEDLAHNNEREWFEDHKKRYQAHVVEPAVAFVTALGPRLQRDFPEVTWDTRTNGAGSVMRIHRDIRFSKDKTPYKTNLGIALRSGDKKMEAPAFYLHLDAQDVRMYAGMHCFDKTMLAAYRKGVADEKSGTELTAIVKRIQRNAGYKVGGEQYKRVPTGYDVDHPRADLLRYGGLYAGSPPIDRQLASTPELIDFCARAAKIMGPLHHWLLALE